MLQFGHGFIAVEITLGAAFAGKAYWLQFGHGFIAVEIRLATTVGGKALGASIRPRLHSRGDMS
ncbi:hypothetical protein FRUB_06437 [Fimbriiglobus ruber]|uniref:Uncharacterized protein n=1 Tax=Fimbriiglobus ruber TaxID=1908690 RepID=A0A225DMA8_9BACT|nr:hypothetical protein FRUB_06437 [Fimbriiglobus ruber]